MPIDLQLILNADEPTPALRRMYSLTERRTVDVPPLIAGNTLACEIFLIDRAGAYRAESGAPEFEPYLSLGLPGQLLFFLGPTDFSPIEHGWAFSLPLTAPELLDYIGAGPPKTLELEFQLISPGTGTRSWYRTAVWILPPSDAPAPTPVPSAWPTGLKASLVTATSVRLTWQAATGFVAGYVVYLDGVEVGVSSGLSYDFIGLTAETTYELTVAAVDDVGASLGLSATLHVSTPAAGGNPTTSEFTYLRPGSLPSLTLSVPMDAFLQAANPTVMRSTFFGDIGAAAALGDADGLFVVQGGLVCSSSLAALKTAIGATGGGQPFSPNLSLYAAITPSTNVQALLGAADFAAVKSQLALNLVQNTALSTWAGSGALTTLGTVTAGIWRGSAIADGYVASATVWNAKEPAIAPGTVGQYWSGNKSWQTLDKAAVGLDALSNAAQVLRTEMGVASGVATLDVGGKIPTLQIPDAILGQVKYQGGYDAATNTPTLATIPSAATKGNYYVVSAAGTFASLSFEVGDWIISNGALWQKIDNTDNVVSVAGRIGAITLTRADVGLSLVENTALSTWAGSGALTDLGTVTTGVWNASIIAGQYGGTGVANTGKTITLGGNLTTAGAFATTLTSTAATSITLPITGTLATLAGAEALSNKTITASAFNGTVGATTPSTGAFTTISTTGAVAFANGTYHTLGGGNFFHGVGGYNVLLAGTNGLNINNQADSAGIATFTSTGLTVTGAISATTQLLVKGGGLLAFSDTTNADICYVRNVGTNSPTQEMEFSSLGNSARAYTFRTYNGTSINALTIAPSGAVTVFGAFGCNSQAAQGKYASGGTLAGVVAALVANGILSN